MSIVETITTIVPMVTIPDFQIPWNVSPEVVKTCRTIGFFAALVWFIWLGAQVLLPKQRNILQQGGGKIWQFVGAAFFIVILMDINMVPTVLNWAIAAIIGGFNMLFGA